MVKHPHQRTAIARENTAQISMIIGSMVPGIIAHFKAQSLKG